MTKKIIQKPENWQDFESLCKKLWGEIYNIPNEIKKNGRAGQAQHGVDVYGIPNGKRRYFGIQCKGKDEYSNAKLTETEIDNEIEKAKIFNPPLSLLIFATTANKDSKIEEYIRLKNERTKFRVLLFCWEDIADLIEENRNTHDWYVKNLMHKSNFDFNILFNDFKESIILRPKLKKRIVTYKYIEQSLDEKNEQLLSSLQRSIMDMESLTQSIYMPYLHRSDTINKSWVDFEIILDNSGSEVIEDWNFSMNFTGGVYSLDDDSGGFLLANMSLINISKDDPRYIDKESQSISYTPVGKSVLVQKQNKYFKVSILVELDATEVSFDWELVARDYSKSGTKKLKVLPEYISVEEIEEVLDKNHINEDVIIDYYRIKIEDKKK